MSKSTEEGVVETRETDSLNETARSVDDRQNRVFELMSNQRRRYTLHLLERETRVGLGELAEQVAAWEKGKPVHEITASERKNVYSSLQQFHLPKLEAEGMVEFDERAGEVEFGPTAEEVGIYLEVVESGDVPWSYYYLGLAVVSAGLVTSSLSSAYPFSLVSPVAATAVVVTALAVSALVHMYDSTTEMRLGTGEQPPDVER